jgi:hypothetical protein
VPPAGELEGELLLKLGRPTEAERLFEKTLRREPNQPRTVFGAPQRGDRATAQARSGEYVALDGAGRPDAARAVDRATLARNALAGTAAHSAAVGLKETSLLALRSLECRARCGVRRGHPSAGPDDDTSWPSSASAAAR